MAGRNRPKNQAAVHGGTHRNETHGFFYISMGRGQQRLSTNSNILTVTVSVNVAHFF